MSKNPYNPRHRRQEAAPVGLAQVWFGLLRDQTGYTVNPVGPHAFSACGITFYALGRYEPKVRSAIALPPTVAKELPVKLGPNLWLMECPSPAEGFGPLYLSAQTVKNDQRVPA